MLASSVRLQGPGCCFSKHEGWTPARGKDCFSLGSWLFLPEPWVSAGFLGRCPSFECVHHPPLPHSEALCPVCVSHLCAEDVSEGNINELYGHDENDNSPNTLLLILLELRKVRFWNTTDEIPSSLQGRIDGDAENTHCANRLYSELPTCEWKAYRCVLLCTTLPQHDSPCCQIGSCRFEYFSSV